MNQETVLEETAEEIVIFVRFVECVHVRGNQPRPKTK